MVREEAETETNHATLSSSAPPEADAIETTGLPVFTPQDEIIEHATLTAPEMLDIVYDLHGITGGVANLRVEKDSTRPAALSSLDDEISKLPAERRAAYCQAVLKCPGLVSDERKMAFLKREDGDPALAAVRLALYWELRLDLFGPEKCFLPMTLEGAMKGEAENMVRWPIHQLLPVKDTAGRAIWYFDPSQRDFDNYSINQELMALWYILEVNSEDPEALTNGLVHISTWKHVEMKHMSPKGGRIKPPAGMLRLIADQAFPIPVRALHFCQPRTVLYYLFPILKSMFGKRVRQRLTLHSGSEAAILQSLEEFRLPKDRVLTELGGEVVPNMAQFLANRMTVESARPDPRLVLEQTPISIPTGPATKRPKSDEPKATTGNTDPRMAVAVKIRLEDPDSPLLDVLLKAGFEFDSVNECGEPTDADNISLAQRKNNLCRRVRKEKAKREAEDAKKVSSNNVNNTLSRKEKARKEAEDTNPVKVRRDNEKVGKNNVSNTSNAIVSGGDVTLGAALEYIKSIIPMMTSDNFENGSVHSSSEESKDSFYDKILDLPGTQGLMMSGEEIWDSSQAA